MPEDLKPFCNSCGLCCTKIGALVNQAKDMMNGGARDPQVLELANFPYNSDDAGRCEKLGTDNRCTVYQNRPDICSIEKGYEKRYPSQMSRADFYKLSEQACLQLTMED